MINNRYSIFFFGLFSFLLGYSQTDHPKIDSLLQKALEYSNKNQDSALHFSKKAYTIAKKEKDTFLIAGTGYYYSYYLISLGEIDYAENILQFNFDNHQKLPDLLIGNTYFNKAAIYDINEQFDKALEFYFLSIDFYKKARNNKWLAKSYLQIGVIYKKLNKLTIANHFFDASLRVGNLKKSDALKEELSHSEKTNASLKMLKEIANGKNEKLKSIVYYNLGYSSLGDGKPHDAIEYLKRSLKIKYRIFFLTNIDETYFLLGRSYFDLKRYDDAIAHFKKALSVNEKRHKKIEIENYLAKAFEFKKNYEQALFHSKNYKILSDSISLFKENERIAEITAQYETEKQAKEILLLEQEKQLLIVKKESNMWRWSLYALIATIISIFLGRELVTSLKRIKKVEKEKEQIAKKVEEIAVILNNKSKVYLDKLKYIKSDGNYLEFVTDEKTIIDRNKLKVILDDLPPNFVRVHRSYVINKNFIDALNSTTLFLKPNIEIPLSRTFKANIA